MKISNKQTAHILIKANTNSEWDCCEFAVIHLSEEWKKLQATRFEAVKPFTDDHTFQSIRFYSTSAAFYQSGGDGTPDIEELLADKDWAFVEIDEDELDELTPPENRLDFSVLEIHRDGNARYKAYGKHTNEEFWTSEFSLQQITGQN